MWVAQHFKRFVRLLKAQRESMVNHCGFCNELLSTAWNLSESNNRIVNPTKGETMKITFELTKYDDSIYFRAGSLEGYWDLKAAQGDRPDRASMKPRETFIDFLGTRLMIGITA